MENKLLVIGLLLIALFSLYPYALAAGTFDLSYTLTEGGSTLELDPLNAYKGVKLEVSSDVATQYEIIQRVIRPLENRDNPGIVIADDFVVRGLRGTNRYGDLRLPTNDTPVRNNEAIYISNAAGDPDNFTLVYGIINTENIQPGYYQGQITFTLRAIGSARSEVTKYLYVYVNIGLGLEAKPRIDISTSTGLKTITLNPSKEDTQTADVLVKITGKFKKLFSINQFLPRPLESKEGNNINLEAVNVAVKEASKGVGTGKIALSSQPKSVYTSGPNGEADESFIITYSLGDLSQQKAGRYTSLIQYSLDEMGVQTRLETLELEIENERVFELLITPENQKGTLEFINLKPTEPPKKNEVNIEIKTNVGKQYQVSQNVLSDLTSKEGETIPAKYFTIQTESLDTKGTLRFNQKEEVKKGSSVLFVSDDKGSADKFKVIYELTCPREVKASDYSTKITYSLLEI